MNHTIEVIDNHSVAVDLLTGGPVLDAGARGFVFSKWFADRGHRVWAWDPSPDIKDPPEGVNLFRRALVGIPSKRLFLDTAGDPNAWNVSESSLSDKAVAIQYSTIADMLIGFFSLGNSGFDVIKLNVEGSEYDILEVFPGDIARQVVVSFHEHTPRARGRAECDRLIDKMRQWYTPIQHVWEQKYCAGWNYWDSLLVRNDLA